MATDLKRYSVGEAISGWPVETWNRICDVVEGTRPPMPMPSMQGKAVAKSCVPIYVHNATAGEVPKGGVLGLDDSYLDLSANATEVFAQMPVLKGIVPTRTAHSQAFCVALQPIAAGGQGWAARSGCVWAMVGITDADHTHARIADSDVDEFASGTYGAFIIARESGTGSKKCLIDLDSYVPRVHVAKLTTSLTGATGTTTVTPGSGTANLHYYNGSGNLVSTGESVTVKNPFVGTASSGDMIECTPVLPTWTWTVTAVDCGA